MESERKHNIFRKYENKCHKDQKQNKTKQNKQTKTTTTTTPITHSLYKICLGQGKPEKNITPGFKGFHQILCLK